MQNKTYILLKDLPNLDRGAVLTWNGTEYVSPDKYLGQAKLNQRLVEGSKDWFRLVEEPNPDWEILAFRHKHPKHHSCIFTWMNAYKGYVLNSSPFVCKTLGEMISEYADAYEISEVKRLSDGESFSIGDKVKWHSSVEDGAIERFEIDHFDKTKISAYRSYAGRGIQSLEKVKEPLFVTEDGYDVTDPSTWIYIVNKAFITWEANAASCTGDNNLKYFLILSNRTKFIEENKPKPVLFTTEDGVNIYIGYDGEIWRVFIEPSSYAQWVPVLLGMPLFLHDGEKYFSTKSAAEEYILMNKPCLSVNNFLLLWPKESTIIKDVKRLAKCKIKPQQ